MQKNASCRFSLAVMSDDYKEKILSALASVDTNNLDAKTDLLATTYNGHIADILNSLQHIFTSINDNHTHITMEANLSSTNIAREITNTNHEIITKSFLTHGKVAIYPLGTVDYKSHIMQTIDIAKRYNLCDMQMIHGCDFHGDVNEIFNFLHEIYGYASVQLDDFVIQFSLSINSPTLN